MMLPIESDAMTVCFVKRFICKSLQIFIKIYLPEVISYPKNLEYIILKNAIFYSTQNITFIYDVMVIM